MKTDFCLAQHELAHIIAGALSLKRWHPELYPTTLAEISIHETGGYACLVPEQLDGPAIPQSVLRHMAMGPICAGGIEPLREVMRAKLIPRDGKYLSNADWLMIATKSGSDVLSLDDCSLLAATAKICHSEAFDEAARVIAECKTLTMSLGHFLNEDAAKRAWVMAGKDFETLHSRFDGLPDWAVKSISNKYERAMALSPAL